MSERAGARGGEGDSPNPDAALDAAAFIRQESLFGRLPLLLSEREYGTAGAHATCFAYAVATWCFLTGGYVAQYVGAIDGVICLVTGSVIGTFIGCMATGVACHRYGLEQMDYSKTTFGQRGVRILLIFFLFNMIGWSGLILVMFGNGVRNILDGLGYDPGAWVVGAAIAVGIWLTYLLVTRGVHLLNISNAYISPCLGVLTVVMFAMLLHKHGWQEILAAQPTDPFESRWLNYAIAFELSVAGGISWWGGVGFLTRNTKTRRNSVYPELIQLGVFMSFVCCVSLFSSLVVQTDDPTEWMIPIGGVVMGVLALGFVAAANISSTAVSIYVSGLALRHLKPLRTRPWWHLVVWSLVPCVPFVFWPEQLYDLGDRFVAYNGALYAPVCGILFADYFLVRRQKLNIWAVFEDDPAGEYHFRRGFNWAALVCTLLGFGFYLGLFNPATFHANALFHYLTASVPATVVPALVYWVWMSRWPRRWSPPSEGVRRLRRPNI